MDIMFKRYGDPLKMIEQMSWRQIPRFIKNLIKETQEEEIERVWYAKDIDKGLEEYRKESWRRAKRNGQGKTNKAQQEAMRKKEEKAGFVSINIDELEL